MAELAWLVDLRSAW